MGSRGLKKWLAEAEIAVGTVVTNRIRERLTYANTMATVAVFLALGGGAFAAVNGIPGRDGKINACFKKRGGQLRAVKKNAKCRRGESPLSWNQQGKVGPPGGDASLQGVVAGGELAGTYPNPSIADGVVGASKLASGSVTTSKFGTIPAVRVRNSASQSISTGSATNLSFDTEAFDTESLFDPANPTQLTVSQAGVYLLSGTAEWAGNATGTRVAQIKVNGTIVGRVAGPPNSAGGTTIEQEPTTVMNLAAGDVVRLSVYQTSGGDLNVNAQTADSPVLAATWLGPAS